MTQKKSRARTKEQISFNMSRILSRGSRIEKLFAEALREEKLSFRRHLKTIEGTPDFLLLGKKTVVFCDSSFWHGYKFLKTKRHKFKTNKKFWVEKIAANIIRDRFVNKTLRKTGWKVFRFWDFQIKKDIKKCIRKIKNLLPEE